MYTCFCHSNLTSSRYSHRWKHVGLVLEGNAQIKQASGGCLIAIRFVYGTAATSKFRQ